MSQSDDDVLWSIFSFVRVRWNTAQTSKMTRTQFLNAAHWQVGRDPSYRLYYDHAVAEYRRLLAANGGQRRPALTQLFDENRLPDPKLADVANFVLLEFMRWDVAFGAFRSYDYVNYTGWMGGGSFLTVPPPYRALSGRSAK